MKTLKFLRLIAILEGVSFILLLGIAVPLKYIYGYTEATKEIGMAHGILFMLYCVMIIPAKEKFNWSLKHSFMAFIASLLPFGTFIADYVWFRHIKVN